MLRIQTDKQHETVPDSSAEITGPQCYSESYERQYRKPDNDIQCENLSGYTKKSHHPILCDKIFYVQYMVIESIIANLPQ